MIIFGSKFEMFLCGSYIAISGRGIWGLEPRHHPQFLLENEIDVQYDARFMGNISIKPYLGTFGYMSF